MPESEGLTPSERYLRSSLGAHISWANTENRTERTAPARRAFEAQFEQQADPDGVLHPVERARRAESLRKAYFARLALKSAQARRRRSAVKERLAEMDGGAA